MLKLNSIDLSGERNLWKAVLLQICQDLSIASYNDKYNYLKRKAYEYFTSPEYKEDVKNICKYADLNFSVINNNVNNIVSKNFHVNLFTNTKIRKIYYNNNWYFVVKDVINVIKNSNDIKSYIKFLRKKKSYFNKHWEQVCKQIPFEINGIYQPISCLNLNDMLKFIQLIPHNESKKII